MNFLKAKEYIKGTEVYKNLFNIYEKYFKTKVSLILEEKDISNYFDLSDRVGNGITYNDFENKVMKLNNEDKKSLLKYIVEKGKFATACEFSQKFNINTDYIEYDVFVKGFKQSSDRIGNGLTMKDATGFIFLYKSPEDLYDFVAKEGYIEISYSLKEKYPNLPKFSKVDISSILEVFTKKRKEGTLFFGICSDYKTILKSISINPEDDYIKLENILKLSEEEKEKGKGLLKDTLFSNEHFTGYLKNKFKKSIEELILSLNNMNFNFIGSFLLDNRDDIDKIDNYINLELTKIGIENIIDTPILSIYYDSFENKMKVLILQEKNILLLKEETSYIEIIRDKKEYFNKIKEINNEFSDNFKKFNIPYSFLLFKMKGGTKDFPLKNIISGIEAINNKNYRQQHIEIA